MNEICLIYLSVFFFLGGRTELAVRVHGDPPPTSTPFPSPPPRHVDTGSPLTK